MSAPVELPTEEIDELCERYGVARLELFGSAATPEFGEASDVDFIVKFADRSPGYADRYLDFAEALEGLLGRRVDLVTERSIQNPFSLSCRKTHRDFGSLRRQSRSGETGLFGR